MAIGRSPSRDPRRRPSPSAVASSSRRSVRRVLSPVAKFCKRALRRGASSSGSSTHALTFDSSVDATAGPAAEDEEDEEENINDVNNISDDGDIPVDATDESSNERKDTQEPTEYDIPESNTETVDDKATIKDAPPTSSVAVGSVNARHASPPHTPDETTELTVPGITARSDDGSKTCTKESVTGTNDDQNVTEMTDNAHTDVPTSYPVTDGATIPTAAGSSTDTTIAVSENGHQTQSASNKGKKRAANVLADDGEPDDEGEGMDRKRARMCGEEEETEEKRKEERREGKKRARSDDDDESPASSGEEAIELDDPRQAKRPRRSTDGPSSSYGSPSPRHPGATCANDANNSLPTPEESQETESQENVPAVIPAPPMAQVIATLTFHGLVTPDASDASDDDDSDSSYSYSGSLSSYDSDDTDSSSGYDSDDTLVAPAPAAAPVFIMPPPPPTQLVPPPTQLRRARAFYGTAMLRKILRAPYI